jgi:hypothetical protein
MKDFKARRISEEPSTKDLKTAAPIQDLTAGHSFQSPWIVASQLRQSLGLRNARTVASPVTGDTA